MSKMRAEQKPKTRSGRPLLDYEDAAHYLGFTERYTRRLVAEKRLPHIKTADGRTGRVYFDPDALDGWIASRAVPVDA
jgi:excisionase family DNA binding protein